MTKEDHIHYWKANASLDWKRVNILFKNKDYVFALFCVHLTLEKLIKAYWVKDNKENIPPKIHNLVTLCDKTKLELPEEMRSLFEKINSFQLEGRYPDYQNKIYKLMDKKTTSIIISEVNISRKWLLKNL